MGITGSPHPSSCGYLALSAQKKEAGCKLPGNHVSYVVQQAPRSLNEAERKQTVSILTLKSIDSKVSHIGTLHFEITVFK